MHVYSKDMTSVDPARVSNIASRLSVGKNEIKRLGCKAAVGALTHVSSQGDDAIRFSVV